MAKSYKNMTREERRIAIAEDVIKHLDAMDIRSGYGYVVGSEQVMDNFDGEVNEKSSKKIAEEMKQSCAMCARGAMMICKIAKFDNYKFCYSEINNTETLYALEDAFNYYELYEIEEAFENFYHDSNFTARYWSDINDPKDRLLAIMQNIVDNGRFNPQIEYEIVEK